VNSETLTVLLAVMGVMISLQGWCLLTLHGIDKRLTVLETLYAKKTTTKQKDNTVRIDHRSGHDTDGGGHEEPRDAA
jgi:hypothetical protein